ncbi:MAG: serine acetyltransferase [Chlorobi bacterium]|nr:serine acetyltransferase [Chlorobiota bacterium]
MKEKISIPHRGQFKEFVRGKVPEKIKVFAFVHAMIEYLFPVLSEEINRQSDEYKYSSIEKLLKEILSSYDTGLNDIQSVIHDFFITVPELYNRLVSDARAIYEGDPAAGSVEEVMISYPGFYAILIYRIAHALSAVSVPVMPRMLTEYAHGKTGIDIHPKARIGRSFCIDHGTGIVIGETTEIGDHVKIYQGVTLGAISVSKEKASMKRHPTIEDYVTIYSGATILGGKTIIGNHSVIGGNVWLTHSIAPWSMVLNKNEVILKKNGNEDFESIDYII